MSGARAKTYKEYFADIDKKTTETLKQLIADWRTLTDYEKLVMLGCSMPGEDLTLAIKVTEDIVQQREGPYDDEARAASEREAARDKRVRDFCVKHVWMAAA